jgi:hypothetical protein
MPKLTDAERAELRALMLPVVSGLAEVSERVVHASDAWRAVLKFLHDRMDEGQRHMQMGKAIEQLGLSHGMVTVMDSVQRNMGILAEIAKQPPPPAMDDIMGWLK